MNKDLNKQAHIALITVFICIWPQLIFFPPLLSAFLLLVGVYAALMHFGVVPQLSTLPMWALNILGLLLVYISYPGFLLNPFYIALLTTFVCLKLLEIKSKRDVYTLAFSSFYLIFSVLVHVQELWVVLYLMAAVLSVFSLFLSLTAAQASLFDMGHHGVKALLFALPVSILLFYTFPRFSNPLWHLPGAKTASTGFSEQMKPGDIESLFFSSKRVMRIEFATNFHASDYWRGLVLELFDGQSWQPLPKQAGLWRVLPNIDNQHDQPDYQVLLEPHGRSWLFYQGYIKKATPRLEFDGNIGLKAWRLKQINQRFHYSVITQHKQHQSLSGRDKLMNLKLIKGSNPKLMAFAQQQWQRSGQDAAKFRQRIASYIFNQPYYYTLQPPALSQGLNNMDEFWFQSRAGYCEHYASAVAVIFRAAGIPARVVIGYYGGEWNPAGAYLEIRERDAHAWVSYWDGQHGWKRFDATQYIHPSRIDQRIATLRGEQKNSQNWMRDQSWRSNLSFLNQLSIQWESARYFLDRWLLFYNQESQASLLNNLGLSYAKPAKLLVWSILLLVLLMLSAYLIQLIRIYYQKPTHLRAWQRLHRQLYAQGIILKPSDSLPMVLEKLIDIKPQLKAKLRLEQQRYVRLRYLSRETKDKEVSKLIKRIYRLLNS